MIIQNAVYNNPKKTMIKGSFNNIERFVPVGDNRFYRAIVEQGISISAFVPDAKPNPANEAETKMMFDPNWRAWVKRQARKESKTPRQIINEIKSDT